MSKKVKKTVAELDAEIAALEALIAKKKSESR